jgi:hypothetical protein
VWTDAAHWHQGVRLPDGFGRKRDPGHRWAIRGGAKEVEIYYLGDAGASCRGGHRGHLLDTGRDEGASGPGLEKLHGHRLGSQLKVNPTKKGRRQGEKRIRGEEPSSSCSIDAMVLISESDATCALLKRHMEKGKRWMTFRLRPKLKKTRSCHMEAKEKGTSHHMNRRR